MSKQNNKGVWVVPNHQVVEFMCGPVNYDKLVSECLKNSEKNLLKQAVYSGRAKSNKQKKSRSRFFRI